MKFSISNFLRQQIFVMVCCFSFLANAQEFKLSDNAQISVLTCGSGNEMYSIFGHTAIRVLDPINNFDVVYNYGMFDFNTPNFYSKFIKGDLLYSVGIESYPEFIQAYAYHNRSVNEQYLQLNLKQKQAILDRITQQLASNERYYQYKFIDNNCTTKVVDLLNEVLDQPIAVDFEGNNVPKRAILNECLTNHYFEKLGINLLFSKNVDQINQKVFLPGKLMQSISETTVDSVKLEQNNILQYEPKIISEKNNWNTIYFFSIICLILVFLSRIKFFQYFIFSIIGVLGTVVFIVSLITSHSELVWNESLLLFNPLYFLLFIRKFQNLLATIFITFIVVFLIFASFEKIMILLPLILLELIYLWQFKKIKE